MDDLRQMLTYELLNGYDRNNLDNVLKKYQNIEFMSLSDHYQKLDSALE